MWVKKLVAKKANFKAFEANGGIVNVQFGKLSKSFINVVNFGQFLFVVINALVSEVIVNLGLFYRLTNTRIFNF